MFDKKQDNSNLRVDLAHLREELPHISKNGLILTLIAASLTKQQNLAYVSLSAPTGPLVIDPKLIKYIEIVGLGSYGTVWKARLGSNLVAAKKMKFSALSPIEKSALRQEADIMRKLSHPRIVACIGVFESLNEYCMVLEYW